MISGGGKCGPRAWFGRYACKSFGIPTWGVKQPGHAAMSHWMPNSNKWVICLGGPNWTKSSWDGKEGVQFDWEARARAFPNLFDVVVWLRCFECIDKGGHGKGNTRKVQQFWNHLQLLKMKQIALDNDDKDLSVLGSNHDSDHFVLTSIERLMKRCEDERNNEAIEPNADITFQASDFSNTNNAIVMKSFHDDGGNQVHLRDSCFVNYRITVPNEVENRKGHFVEYSLSCRVVTVHAETEPLLLQVKNNVKETSYQVEIPYTEGEWISTQPMEVELLERGPNRLHFFCEKGALGLTIKDFTLKRL